MKELKIKGFYINLDEFRVKLLIKIKQAFR